MKKIIQLLISIMLIVSRVNIVFADNSNDVMPISQVITVCEGNAIFKVFDDSKIITSVYDSLTVDGWIESELVSAVGLPSGYTYEKVGTERFESRVTISVRLVNASTGYNVVHHITFYRSCTIDMGWS